MSRLLSKTVLMWGFLPFFIICRQSLIDDKATFWRNVGKKKKKNNRGEISSSFFHTP
jgi:hypothetical protein